MIHEAESLMQEFAAYTFDSENQPDVLSLYLVVDPSDQRNQGQPKWRIFVKNSLDEIEETLDPEQLKQWKTVRLNDTDERTQWARIRLRLENFLEGYRPEGKTLALFIGPGRELAYELPVALSNFAHYGRPQIAKFLRAADEYEEHMVVLFTQDRARALNIFLGESASDVSVYMDQSWSRKMPKTGHSSSHASRLDEIDRRFAREAAAELNRLVLDSDDVKRIIFGGNMELAHTVRGLVHSLVADRVVAMLPIPIDTPPHEIAAQIRPVAETAEREYEEQLVDQLISRAAAGGRAAVGQVAVNQALDRAQVSQLVLTYPSDMVAADEMLVKALYSGADTEFVEGEAARKLDEAGGAGAFLYFTR
jgi:hypothetical protein